jgi:hypothetical protein
LRWHLPLRPLHHLHPLHPLHPLLLLRPPPIPHRPLPPRLRRPPRLLQRLRQKRAKKPTPTPHALPSDGELHSAAPLLHQTLRRTAPTRPLQMHPKRPLNPARTQVPSPSESERPASESASDYAACSNNVLCCHAAPSICISNKLFMLLLPTLRLDGAIDLEFSGYNYFFTWYMYKTHD